MSNRLRIPALLPVSIMVVSCSPQSDTPEATAGDVYWVDANILEQFRPRRPPRRYSTRGDPVAAPPGLRLEGRETRPGKRRRV